MQPDIARRTAFKDIEEIGSAACESNSEDTASGADDVDKGDLPEDGDEDSDVQLQFSLHESAKLFNAGWHDLEQNAKIVQLKVKHKWRNSIPMSAQKKQIMHMLQRGWTDRKQISGIVKLKMFRKYLSKHQKIEQLLDLPLRKWPIKLLEGFLAKQTDSNRCETPQKQFVGFVLKIANDL